MKDLTPWPARGVTSIFITLRSVGHPLDVSHIFSKLFGFGHPQGARKTNTMEFKGHVF